MFKLPKTTTPETDLDYEQTPEFAAWQSDPSPDNTGRLLNTLKPVLQKGVRTFVGEENPVLFSRARRLAAAALPRYQPQQGKLNTFVMSHLQGLRRHARKQTTILPISERLILSYGPYQQAKADLTDELDREPTHTELADHLGWSPARVQQLANLQTGISSGQMEQISDEGVYSPSVRSTTGGSAWLDLIYPDLSPLQQSILDHTLGRNGRPRLSNQALAKKLKVTPGYVSQQKSRIQNLLDQEQLLSPFDG
jgi:hypothetical protein